MKPRKGCRKPVQDFFLNLRFSMLKLTSGSSLSGSRGAWGGSQRWGPSLRHTYLPLGGRPDWLVQSKRHQNTTSWVQPSRNWPTSPTSLLSQGGGRSHHRSPCSANPRLSVLAKEGRPQKCGPLPYHPLLTPLSHLLSPSFTLLLFFLFLFRLFGYLKQTVVWSRLPYSLSIGSLTKVDKGIKWCPWLLKSIFLLTLVLK